MYYALNVDEVYRIARERIGELVVTRRKKNIYNGKEKRYVKGRDCNGEKESDV